MNNRQKTREGIILVSFLLFPATYYYFSPYLIIDATTKGIVGGSLVMFTLMFASSLVLGRGFCGWVCPAGGCQEAASLARNKRVTRGDYLKWIIWVPWIAAIVILAVRGGGYRRIDFVYGTEHGLSIGNVHALMTYLAVLLLIVIPAFVVGRRSFCHHLCWMAPFMIAGRRLRNLLRWPSLQLAAEPRKCSHCHTCTNGCPMSLPVESMVERNNMEHTECLLCATCVDGCKTKAIRYSFR